MKLLWRERAVILPGCLLAVYDLGRGLCRALYFDADAAASRGTLKDWLVQAGSGASALTQTLRGIRWRRGRTRYELLTSVLDPPRLAATEALERRS